MTLHLFVQEFGIDGLEMDEKKENLGKEGQQVQEQMILGLRD